MGQPTGVQKGLGAPADTERDEVAAWASGLEAMHARLAGRCGRPESQRRALASLQGLLSPLERKHGWQLAEHAGDPTPDGLPRLLATYQWAADRVRDDLRPAVLEHRADSQAVLVCDETGVLTKGTTSVGVQRQYTGTAGRIEPCQLGVFWASASPPGRPFIDRELYLPQRWAEEGDRRREAGGPDAVTFATKPQLAQRMLVRVLAAGVRVPWVTAAEVDGGDPALRRWLEEPRQPWVLAVRANKRVWSSTGARLRRSDWQRLRAGEGAKGPRLYAWALQPLLGPIAAGWGHRLRVRRRRGQPTDLAYYVVFGPVSPPVAEGVRVAGSRWASEESAETANGEVGLDHYEVRRWTGWDRHITLALLAHAYLPVRRAHAAAAARAKGGSCGRRRAVPPHACRRKT